jgi:hypothetical protein
MSSKLYSTPRIKFQKSDQDHRAIKSRIWPMLGFKEFVSAQITLAGVELLHRIRQGQFALRKLRVAKKTAPEIWNALLAAEGGKPSRSSLAYKSQLCTRAVRLTFRLVYQLRASGGAGKSSQSTKTYVPFAWQPSRRLFPSTTSLKP